MEYMDSLLTGMGIFALVLTLAALASGVVERAPVSFPILFLGIGFVLGTSGILEVDVYNPALTAVGIISLALVLFLDAVNIQINELRREWRVPVLTLGPGIVLTILGVALAAYLLVGVTPLQALLLGAILASTDPVVLRDVIRVERIPRSIRRALSIEAGMSDLVVLPVVLVMIAVLTQSVGSAGDWVSFLVRVLLLSPLVGLAVGGFGAYLIGLADRRFGVMKEYQALYGIGLVLVSYVGGQAINGDGFLAAFFGGLAITLFNVSLCECFKEYGETTAEMMMLLAFMLFGAVLPGLLGTLDLLPVLALAGVALGIVRPLAVWLVLRKASMSGSARGFIGWFGPRGLDSLLLALLVVQADAPDAERLLAITGGVVVVSVIVHGISATPLSNWYAGRVSSAPTTLAEERESTFAGLFDDAPEDIAFLTPDALYAQMEVGNAPLILDVRARAHYEQEASQIPGSVRVQPDQIKEWAAAQTVKRPVVAYCACPDDATSARVARTLKDLGFPAAALQGGYNAWQARYPVEPRGMLPVAQVA